jgi:hypothetical protein
VRNNGHNIPNLQDTVLAQHVISSGDRIDLAEKIYDILKEPGLIY